MNEIQLLGKGNNKERTTWKGESHHHYLAEPKIIRALFTHFKLIM